MVGVLGGWKGLVLSTELFGSLAMAWYMKLGGGSVLPYICGGWPDFFDYFFFFFQIDL